MDNQPFLLAELDSGESIILNENQVVSIKKAENNHACVKMSNGEEFVVKVPAYDAWENDFFTRKW